METQRTTEQTPTPPTSVPDRKLRLDSNVASLLERRADLYGVVSMADFLSESVRWTA